MRFKKKEEPHEPTFTTNSRLLSVITLISSYFRRDCSPTHMAAYRAAILAAQAHIIDTLSDRSSGICLTQLVTNPSYFWFGAVSLLLEWGIAWAEQDHVPITLFAGPMAIDLYCRYGFQTIMTVEVRCSGEETGIELPGMKWEPSAKEEEKEESIVIVYDEKSSTWGSKLLHHFAIYSSQGR